VRPRSRAVAGAGGRFVAPQRLHGERRAGVALDVAHRPRDRQNLRAAGDRAGQRLADPRALVAVLVGVERVVPAAQLLLAFAAADDVLGAGIGDRLLDLVAEHDRDPVELAFGAGVDGVFAAVVGAAFAVDLQHVGHVRVGDARRDAVVEAVLDARLGVVVEGAVSARVGVRVAEVLRLGDHEVGVREVLDVEVLGRTGSLGGEVRVGVVAAARFAFGGGAREVGGVRVVGPDPAQHLGGVGDVLFGAAGPGLEELGADSGPFGAAHLLDPIGHPLAGAFRVA